jgi:hypothetical protein
MTLCAAWASERVATLAARHGRAGGATGRATQRRGQIALGWGRAKRTDARRAQHAGPRQAAEAAGVPRWGLCHTPATCHGRARASRGRGRSRKPPQASRGPSRQRRTRRAVPRGRDGGRARQGHAPRTAVPGTPSYAGCTPRRELQPRATAGKLRTGPGGARRGSRSCRTEGTGPPRERRVGVGGRVPRLGRRAAARGGRGRAGATRRGHATSGEPRTARTRWPPWASHGPRAHAGRHWRAADRALRSAHRDKCQDAHHNKEEGRGKGEGEGGFTSTAADELRASSKSVIRLIPVRRQTREEFRLGSWEGGGRLDLEVVGAAHGGSCARVVGDAGAASARWAQRAMGRRRAGPRHEPAGPRGGRSPVGRALGSSAGPRGHQVGPGRGGKTRRGG